jgi:hypothetical protein
VRDVSGAKVRVRIFAAFTRPRRGKNLVAAFCERVRAGSSRSCGGLAAFAASASL